MRERETTQSVLIVEEEPEILVLLSRILENNGIRALRARGASEAVEIAERAVPIDLILSNAGDNNKVAPDLTALREMRPGIRSMYMSAFYDSGVIRIGLLRHGDMAESGLVNDIGLVGAIRAAIAAPRVSAGGAGSGFAG
jgi:response regulator RpfG family c-di-GMP phosphodiesterase